MSGQLTFPARCSAVPVKSTRTLSPAISTVARMVMSAGSIPSPSITSAALPRPSGRAAMRGPHPPLGVAVELVHPAREAQPAVALGELAQPPGAELLACALGAQVGQPLLGPAHVGDQHAQQVVGQPHRRDHDALLDQLARPDRHAGRHHPADVGVVGARHHEAEVVDPRDERDVGQVGAAGVGVVDDEGVTGLEAELAAGGDGVGHRAEVHGDVLGLGDHPPACVEHRGRAVAPLVDVG